MSSTGIFEAHKHFHHLLSRVLQQLKGPVSMPRLFSRTFQISLLVQWEAGVDPFLLLSQRFESFRCSVSKNNSRATLQCLSSPLPVKRRQFFEWSSWCSTDIFCWSKQALQKLCLGLAMVCDTGVECWFADVPHSRNLAWPQRRAVHTSPQWKRVGSTETGWSSHE